MITQETALSRAYTDALDRINKLATQNSELLEALKAALPWLCDHVAQNINTGPADRIALDKVEAAINRGGGPRMNPQIVLLNPGEFAPTEFHKPIRRRIRVKLSQNRRRHTLARWLSISPQLERRER